MKVIWKYTIDSGMAISPVVPQGARPLSVGMQGGKIAIWVMVDPSMPKVQHHFAAVGTGHTLHGIDTWGFVGSVQDGDDVWHIFHREEEP